MRLPSPATTRRGPWNPHAQPNGSGMRHSPPDRSPGGAGTVSPHCRCGLRIWRDRGSPRVERRRGHGLRLESLRRSPSPRRTYVSPHLRFHLGRSSDFVDQGAVRPLLSPGSARASLRGTGGSKRCACSRARPPGAQLFLTTPNESSAWPLIEWTLDQFRLVPTLAEAQHLTLFTRARLARALGAGGWDVEEMGTFNGVAPFLAPVSERLARAVEAGEFRTRRIMPYNLLFCRARRGPDHGSTGSRREEPHSDNHRFSRSRDRSQAATHHLEPE